VSREHARSSAQRVAGAEALKRLLYVIALVLAAAAGGCLAALEEKPADSTVVFVLDAPMDEDFVEGRAVGLQISQVSHGSLVGRVIRSYCRAPLVSVPVEDPGGGVSKSAYVEGLRTVARYVENHPQARAVVNISLGSSTPDAEEEGVIRRLTETGALVIAAAGNDAKERLTYPAAYPGVIAVAGATRYAKARSSNYGQHVGISASGDITFIDYEFLPQEWLRRRTEAEGTSFAAPKVAATIAYLLEMKAQLTPRQAYDIVRATSQPVADSYFRRGLLGAGVLDVHRAKSAVDPLYSFVHLVLPVSVWIVLGITSLYLCVRYTLVGVFLTLVLWLAALPASVLLVIKLGDCLEFVGGGSLVLGLGVTGIFAAGVAVAALIQQWQLAKAVAALSVPFVGFVTLASVGLTPRGGPIAGATGAAAAGIGGALVLEMMTRRRLQRIRLYPRAAGDTSGPLLAAYRRAFDGRVKAAVVEALQRVPDDDAVGFLLQERRCRPAVARSLTRIAADHLEALVPPIGRLRSLKQFERERLLAALRRAGNAAAVPYLEEAAAGDRTGDVQRLIESLKAAAPGAP